MAALMTGICGGVDIAHKSGIFHRDLKPENILLPESGTGPKVVDFGVAKLTDTGTGDGSTISVAGTIVGTPAYMAPEQLRGEAVDARADVFSLGVMAYEMLTARLPYTGASLFDIGMQAGRGQGRHERHRSGARGRHSPRDRLRQRRAADIAARVRADAAEITKTITKNERPRTSSYVPLFLFLLVHLSQAPIDFRDRLADLILASCVRRRFQLTLQFDFGEAERFHLPARTRDRPSGRDLSRPCGFPRVRPCALASALQRRSVLLQRHP